MTTILLKEMSYPEINWMQANGQRINIKSGTIVVAPEKSANLFYLVLDGEFTAYRSDLESAQQSVLEVACLFSGQIFGAIPFLPEFLSGVTVRALTPATVLAISQQVLTQKLEDDLRFAAHFYRATARLIMQRLIYLSQQLSRPVAQLSQMQLREASVVFAELQDSDLDWLIAVGRVQSLNAETLLAEAGRPMDDLHLILDGAAALHLVKESPQFLADAELGPEFARLSRGDWVGETLMIDAFPTHLTVRTIRETEVLSIPKWRLQAKLWHDPDFASRFYRVLAILLANRQQSVIQQLVQGDNKRELDHQRLTQMTLAEARFEWMLKRIQTQLKSGATVQW